MRMCGLMVVVVVVMEEEEEEEEKEEEEEEVLLILDTGIAASIQLSMRSLNPSSADPYTSLKPAIKFSRSIEW